MVFMHNIDHLTSSKTMKNVIIQYASDIHLEIYPNRFRKIIDPKGDILILNGDIGHPFKQTYFYFLKWCKVNFKYVVLIPGNREYYGSSIKKAQKKMKRICKKTGVIFLNCGALEILEYNIVILGATLWSKIPESNTFDVFMSTDDYKCIGDFSPDISNDFHIFHKKWLRERIKFYKEYTPQYKIIVATHHAPVSDITLAPMHRGKTMTCFYSSECTDIMKGVYMWIYGHTHYNATFPVRLDGPDGEEIIITSNQRGYPGEITTYQKDQYVTIYV